MSLERLCKTAKRIDRIDAVTGPLSVALYHSGSEVFSTAGMAISFAELAFLKIPFLISYVVQTKDATLPLFIAAKEVVANSSKLSGLIDIVPFYHMALQYKQSEYS